MSRVAFLFSGEHLPASLAVYIVSPLQLRNSEEGRESVNRERERYGGLVRL
jgi:hypothetical protein